VYTRTRVILFGFFWAKQHKGDFLSEQGKRRAREIFELTTVKAAVSFFV